MRIKTVSQSTLEQVLHAWNKGFEGYFVKIDMSEEMFLTQDYHQGCQLLHLQMMSQLAL